MRRWRAGLSSPAHPIPSSTANRYCALGRASDVAAAIARFRDAGVRHFVVDMIGEPEERSLQLEKFANEVIPLVQ